MIAVVYARTGSSRFPQKCFAPFGGCTLIEYVCERVGKCNVTDVYLATTDLADDDELVQLFEDTNIKVFRGDPEDLVLRTRQLLEVTGAKEFCRINGDSPFVDIDLLNFAINKYNEGNLFVSNIIERTYPYGIAVEVINSDYYLKSAPNALIAELEHVTKHLYRDLPDLYFSIKSKKLLSKYSLTIDTRQDYNDIMNLLSKLSKDLKNIRYLDLVKYLK